MITGPKSPDESCSGQGSQSVAPAASNRATSGPATNPVAPAKQPTYARDAPPPLGKRARNVRSPVTATMHFEASFSCGYSGTRRSAMIDVRFCGAPMDLSAGAADGLTTLLRVQAPSCASASKVSGIAIHRAMRHTSDPDCQPQTIRAVKSTAMQVRTPPTCWLVLESPALCLVPQACAARALP